ncbi:MAG: response regulator, partial [Verrucomicrobiota bacterium]
MTDRPINVLVVDDSAVVRRVLRARLPADGTIRVCGTAPDPFIARKKIIDLKPDVMLLDIEMPRMDGLTFLKRVMHYLPMPVIIFSSMSETGSAVALQALAAGAIDVVLKPTSHDDLAVTIEDLVRRIQVASATRVRRAGADPASAGVEPTPARPVPASSSFGASLIAIGASTGGTVAIERILRALPPEAPGVLVVQHMPPGFTRAFAERLDGMCSFLDMERT